MKLQVLLPTEIFLDEEEVRKVTAEAPNGSFTLLPRHIDFVTTLVPGILIFEDRQGQERYMAVDEGVLVKAGDEVKVSTRKAVAGKQLGELETTIREQFAQLDEKERSARTAVARLESDLVRRFVELS